MRKLFFMVALAEFGVLTRRVFAQTGPSVEIYIPEPPQNITGLDSFFFILGKIVRYVYWLFLILAVIFFILAAVNYLTSGGDAGKVKKASGQLTYGIVAIVVGLLAFSATYMISRFLSFGGK